ncbi:velvet factor-domain-containing protein [Gilbertella persicaria]|uniref:velvet factor-domain-containing protein n=1 Tax=Gilbertella persicaria TaxID=101096 RepID=UPI00221ED796|nr:velvet factor-domain-containing protein [Gilbertella persicaria]KAI8056535.1 velvet factor-domain-containing protein [Gilbertella persicaria]
MSVLIPPPLGLGRPSQKSKKYKLIVIQHPIRARCCGFGEKDRRPIDPPPVLQLFIEKPDGTLQNANDDDCNISLFVVQCDLYSEDGKEQRGHVYNPSSTTSPNGTFEKPIPTTGTLLSFQDPAPTRSLMGAVVSNAYQLTDHHNQPGIFFIFQDLSVRVEGRFSLKFMFINLSAGDPLTMSTQISDSVFSDPFTVYSAKNFPGMTDSTPLSQCFSQQSIKISIRKGRRIRRVVDRTSYNNNTLVDHHRTLKDTDYDNTPSSSKTTPNNSNRTIDSNHAPPSTNNNEEEEQQQQQQEQQQQQQEQGSSSKPTYRRIHISTFLSPP